MHSKRTDLSQWVIHFVHDKNTDNDPTNWYPTLKGIPIYFNEKGNPIYSDLEYWEMEYPIDHRANAFSVLMKILFDGYIKAGWSFRNGSATIYGPSSAVCFTEMPLYALLSYAQQRNNGSLVNCYGIALLKEELYKAGGRPVIYGLTGKHEEAKKDDPNFGLGFRCLSSSCGLGLNEQYRYVATKLFGDKKIDWTHEREWRWPIHGKSDTYIPGLPAWLEDDEIKFSKVIIIVQEVSEANRFLDKMKELYDSGANNYSSMFNKFTLSNTSVLALENVHEEILNESNIRLEDLPLKSLACVIRKIPSVTTIEKVRNVFELARKCAIIAADELRKSISRDENGFIRDLYGTVAVITYDSNSEITEALFQLGLARPIGGVGYFIDKITSHINDEGMLCISEIAAKKAAEVLTMQLGQAFYTKTYLD